MLVSLAVGVAFTAAADAAERLSGAWRQPRRFAWVGALVATACWPLVAILRAGADQVREGPAESAAALQVGHALQVFTSTTAGGGFTRQLDAVLLGVWCLVSGWLLARLLVGMYRVRRGRQLWRSEIVDGVPVRISKDEGPAAVGFPPDVVLPEWVLDLEQPLRALVLRHEVEHRAARDPYLLFFATALVALVPWNVALWVQSRRLRLAIEIDCDARVLRAHPGPDRYARLLLLIGLHRSGPTHSLAPGLLEPASNLERRITAMRVLPQPAARLRLLLLASVLIAAAALACSIEPPERPRVSADPTLVTLPKFPDDATDAFLEYQVEKPVQPIPGTVNPTYPTALRAAGVEGEIRLQFIVDTAGRVEPRSLKVTHSTNELFSDAALEVVPRMTFHPAEIRGRKVRQLVELPFAFLLRH